LIQEEMIFMGKITETVNRIYCSKLPLDQKIIRLVEYGRKCGINSYNFDILLSEIKKYNWQDYGLKKRW